MAGDSSEICWNVDMEVNLFHAMRGHKPAGVNKHFQMISIHDRLSSANKRVSAEDVWNHLSTLYDLQALNESEIIPFPNKGGEFEILETELAELCEKNFPRTPYINTPSADTVKSEGSSKSSSKSGKQESKSSWQTPKSETKAESKSSSSKSDSRSNTPASRSESKTSQGSTTKSSQLNVSSSTPEPSPKRTKRTRNVPSASASPATPTEPPAKRRR